MHAVVGQFLKEIVEIVVSYLHDFENQYGQNLPMKCINCDGFGSMESIGNSPFNSRILIFMPIIMFRGKTCPNFK
jgi:hypothetical protein